MQQQKQAAAAAAVAAAAAAAAAAQAKEYKPLALRSHTSSPFITYVFIKHHQQKQDETEVANALYVTGLPLGLDDASMAAIFGCFGPVTDIVVHPSKRSAAVVFDSSEGVAAALSYAGSGQIVEYELPPAEGPLGLKAWVAQHKALRPGNSELQQQLDQWMEAHDAAEAAKEAARQAAMSEDGWTVVVRSKGRKRAREVGGVSTVSGGIAQAAAAAALAASDSKQQKQAKHQREAGNFYRFQQRDKRRNELLELQQQFEEGRKRLAALKAARHFKPS